MSAQVELTAQQMASLDLLISKMQQSSDPKSWTNDVANNLGAVAANATVGAAVTVAAGQFEVAVPVAVIGAAADATAVAAQYFAGGDTREISAGNRAHWEEIGKRMPLDSLLALRKMAILKK
jgi:hypothetical protein